METHTREEVDLCTGDSSKNTKKVVRLRRLVLPIFEKFISNGGIKDEEYDVTFYCDGGQVVQGHKIILSVVSKYFATVFKDQKPHKPSTVIIPDVKARIMTSILALCYHRNVTINVGDMTEMTTWMSNLGLGLEKFTFQLVSDRMKSIPDTSVTLAKQPVSKSVSCFQPTIRDNIFNAQARSVITMPPKVREECVTELDNCSNQDQATSKKNSRLPTYWLDSTSLHQKQCSQEWIFNSSENVADFIDIPSQDPTANPSVISGFPAEVQISGFPAEIQISGRPNIRSESIRTESESQAHRVLPQQGTKVLHARDQYQLLSKSLEYGPNKRLGSISLLPRILKGGTAKVSKMQCPVCHTIFDENEKWLWHITHHQGNGFYKCTFCNQSFIDAKGVYNHESVIHQVVAPDDITGVELRVEPSFQKLAPKLKSSLVCNGFSEGNTKLQKSLNMDQAPQKSQPSSSRSLVSHSLLKVSRPQMLKANPNSPRLNSTRFFKVKSSASVDSDKVRWLYACLTCKHSSDSSVKAYAHHTVCNAISGKRYEETVRKYRQGHFGKFKCPLCSRKYINLYGFVVHSIHNHPEYKTRLSHVISEDKLMCVNCGGKFSNGEDFHDHLNSDLRCGRSPKKNKTTRYYRKYERQRSEKNEETPITQVGGTSQFDSDYSNSEDKPLSEVGHSKLKGRTAIRVKSNTNHNNMNVGCAVSSGKRPYIRKAKPSATFEYTFEEHSKKILGSNPKSARLQNRLAAVTAFTDEVLTVSEKQNSLSTSENNVDDSVEIDCPVCGCTVKNLGEHLIQNHDVLSATIETIGEAIFRCTICSISFAACDLLAHLKSCTCAVTGSARVSVPGPNKFKKARSPKIYKSALEIPDNIGNSSLDSMNQVDLKSVEVLKEALKCGVCKRVSVKLNVVSDCLKTHGIFRCSLCFNTYRTNENRLLHLKKCHKDGSGNVKCPICNEVRANIGQVTSHMYLKHWSSFYGKHSTADTRRELKNSGLNKRSDPDGKENIADSTVVELPNEIELESAIVENEMDCVSSECEEIPDVNKSEVSCSIEKVTTGIGLSNLNDTNTSLGKEK